AAAAALAFTTRSFGWFYLWVVLGVVAFCLFLAASRYGNMRLGFNIYRILNYPSF
ncbi:BCCT family transporter, partial [candidate division KSB1 bacterium]|nr:BCCT family transporter [candidate division KSB1 bacterium]